MKQETYTLIGRDVQVTVPETLDEAVQRVGAERVLALFTDHVVYHQIATSARNALAARLEAKTKVPRARDSKGAISESPSEYIARLTRDGVISDYTDVLQEVLDKVDFVAAATATRKPASPATPPKSAFAVVAKAAAKPGGREQLARKLSERFGEQFDPNDDTSLARGVQRLHREIQAEVRKLREEFTANL